MSFRLFDFAVEPFTLECGLRLPALPIRGWVWGPDQDWAELARHARVYPTCPRVPTARSQQEIEAIPRLTVPLPHNDIPTVVIVHALTGDAQAGGTGGWWEPLIGPGRPLDPTTMRILCFNNLGSCYGSYGPGDAGFPTRDAVSGTRIPPTAKGSFALPESQMPAPLSTWDAARMLWAALDALNIEHVHRVIGGSVGGMIALCVGALQPNRVGAVLPLAASASASPLIIGWNHIGRQLALLDDRRGLELARQIAHMTYRAEPGLVERQGRTKGAPDAGLTWPYAVQTYLEHQGAALRRRFSVGAYLAQLDVMDNHDLSRAPAPPDSNETWSWTTPVDNANWGLHRLTCPVHALSILQDQLYLTEQTESFVAWLTDHGRTATHTTLSNPHGHDGFLIDSEAVGPWVTKHLIGTHGDRNV